MKYFLFPHQAIVTVNGKTYTISKQDYRFDLLRENLSDSEYVRGLVDHAHFGTIYEGCSYKDGVMYAGRTPLPDAITEQALTARFSTTSVMSIVNLWLSALNRLSDGNLSRFKRDIANIRPFNNEATILLFNGGGADYLSGFDVLRVRGEFPRYTFEQLMGKCFGDKDTKAVRKLVTSRLKSSSDLDLGIFLYGVIGEMMDVNNLLSVMEFGSSYQMDADEVVKKVEEGRPRVKAMFGDLSLRKFRNLFTGPASIHDLLSVTENLKEVLEINPNYVVPAFEDLGGISASLSNIKRRYKSIKVPYTNYLEKWGSIDGLFVDGEELVLPKDSYELGDWGVEMAHCIGGDSYDEGIKDGSRFIWGVKRGGKLWATGYMSVPTLGRQQFYGRKNKPIPEKEKYFDMMEFLIKNIEVVKSFRQTGFNRIGMEDIRKVTERLTAETTPYVCEGVHIG